MITVDLVGILRTRAGYAREEGGGTALGDALHFEAAADRIEALEAAAMRLTSELAVANLKARSAETRLTAVKAEKPTKEMIDDGVLALCMVGVAVPDSWTDEDHAVYVWEAMRAAALLPAPPASAKGDG